MRMHKTISLGFAVLVVWIVSGAPCSTRAEEPKAAPLVRWDYRVVTKEQLLELGNKDLVAGLNNLGDEGWELAAVDGVYIFKRPIRSLTLEEVRQWVFVAQGDVEAWKDRVAWSERMVRKGYLNERRVEDERRQLHAAEFVLERAQKTLKAFPVDRIPSLPKEKQPEK
jgi:hypothetical protein